MDVCVGLQNMTWLVVVAAECLLELPHQTEHVLHGVHRQDVKKWKCVLASGIPLMQASFFRGARNLRDFF